MEQVDRQFYITEMIDRAKVVNTAVGCARNGERVVVHDHSNKESCEGRCILYAMSVTETPWRDSGP
jgi:ribosomal protein S27AE